MGRTLTLNVLSAGPGVSVQDQGRPGYLGRGLSIGGAADPLALWEGAAVLGRPVGAAIEMAGMGGTFEVEGGPVPFAITGAEMGATLDGDPIATGGSYVLIPGQRLTIGGARRGVYGYLSLGGGLDVPEFLGAQSAHLRAGLGGALVAGDCLAVKNGGEAGAILDVPDRLSGGAVRVVRTAQTDLFGDEVLARFLATTFTRGNRANRMGVEVLSEAERFAAASQLSILSEIITPGDVQMTGDGQPFVLGPESQTTGGYPRIATVVPQDVPKVFQAGAGAALRFEEVLLAQALEAHRAEMVRRTGLGRAAQPRLRDPREMADLLAYQLISGATDGGDG